MPVARRAPKFDFEPVDIATVSGSSTIAKDDLGPTIVLGRESHGETTVLFRFALSRESPVHDGGRLQRALLVLEPMPHCDSRPGRMQIELADVLTPWTSSDVARGPLPKLSLPMKVGEAAMTPQRPLRIDVTELVRRWAERPQRYHGLALIVRGNSDSGACYTTGLTRGNGPHLSVFLRAPEESKSTDADGAGGGNDGSDDDTSKGQDP